METLLKATKLVSLLGLSERHIQRLAKEGKLPTQKLLNEKNRPMFVFPLSGLSPELQRKYLAQNQIATPQVNMP